MPSRSLRRRVGLALAPGAIVVGIAACGEASRSDAVSGAEAARNGSARGDAGSGVAAPRSDGGAASDAAGNGSASGVMQGERRGGTQVASPSGVSRERRHRDVQLGTPAPRRAPDSLARWSGRGGFAVAVVARGRSVVLRRSPGGGALKRVGARTEFGSRRTFAVQARRGPWLGVAVPERPNGRLAWVDGRSRHLEATTTTWSLRADLSARRIEVRRDGRVVRRFRVAIGRAGHPTPVGRFAVTDKIDARRYGGTYGCCIVALTGHQPVLPAGWPGGDRLALHGTTATGSVGSAASTGCLRARDDDLRPLMRRLPLGTPVIVRA